jgi:uncharacterized RDD family membrane protein YckC
MSTPIPPPGSGFPEDRPRDQPGPWQQPEQPSGYGQPGPYGGQPYPQQGGAVPAYQQGYSRYGGYGYSAPSVPFADWGSRVGAYLIDSLIDGTPFAIGYGVFIVDLISRSDNPYPDDAPGSFSIVIALVGLLATIGLSLWNRVFRQGRTGQSVGKSALGIKLVDSVTYQPIGAGKSFLRDLLSAIFNNACFLNLLWPLWDDQLQTWHDKVLATYVVKI